MRTKEGTKTRRTKKVGDRDDELRIFPHLPISLLPLTPNLTIPFPLPIYPLPSLTLPSSLTLLSSPPPSPLLSPSPLSILLSLSPPPPLSSLHQVRWMTRTPRTWKPCSTSPRRTTRRERWTKVTHPPTDPLSPGLALALALAKPQIHLPILTLTEQHILKTHTLSMLVATWIE